MNATPERQTMNGKPVFHVPVSTVLNLKSGFEHKLLCDGPALALGDAYAYKCAFCYVPAIDVLRGQLLHPNGKPKWKTPEDRRVVYASPADDVAANMDLVRATVEACALIIEHTNWQIRLLSKSNLLPRVAAMLCDRASREGPGKPFHVEQVRERMIFGFSTGTLDDRVAKEFEEGTPLVSKRIAALHMMQDAGFRTYAMVCPSLPQRTFSDYIEFAQRAAQLLRYNRCEHVWAEVINLRGESFTRTVQALRGGGLIAEAEQLEWVSANPRDWEQYNRLTFLAHVKTTEQWVGKLRYLTYVDDQTRAYWQGHIAKGAVLL